MVFHETLKMTAIKKYTILVTKSTVPVGTAKKVKKNKLMNLFVKKPPSRNPVSL